MEAVNQVLEWLLEAGHDVSREENYDEFKGAITVKMPMSAAEQLRTSNFSSFIFLTKVGYALAPVTVGLTSSD